MKKWLIVIGYRTMTAWHWFDALPEEVVKWNAFNSLQYAMFKNKLPFNWLFVSVFDVFKESDWLQLKEELGLEGQIVIYSHEAYMENYRGGTHDELQKIGFPYQLYHGRSDDKLNNYPFWLVRRVGFAYKGKIDQVLECLKTFTWNEIFQNAKGSCIDGIKCVRPKSLKN